MPTKNRNWVLIRGLVRGQNHWLDFAKFLKLVFPQDGIYFLEIPGNGTRFNEVSPTHFTDLIADFRMQIEMQGLQNEKLTLLTISLGSMVGLAWLEAFPNEIAELICINTSSTLSPFYHRLRPRAFLKLLSHLGSSRSKREQVALELTVNQDVLAMKFLQKFVEEAQLHPVRLRNSLRQLLLATQLRVPEISLKDREKLLFFVSEQDQLVHPQCTQKLAKNYRAPILTHGAAGHDLPNEDPHWLLSQIQKWLIEKKTF